MKAIAIVVTLLFSSGLALAGPNSGGTLIVHCAGAETANSDASLCADGPDPADCSHAVTRVDLESGASPAIFRVYAAFSSWRSPRLMGITWGINYDPAKLFLDGFINCADFSLSDPGWPNPGTGTSETWNAVQTGHMVKVYAFSAYTDHQDVCTITLTPNPTQGGYFGDDAVPAVLDPIAGFGRLGFHSNGTAACPSEIPSGACCTPAGTCVFSIETGCLPPSAWHQGWTSCSPNPCPPPSGACCFADGGCVFLPQAQCTADWRGYGTTCSPNPCPQPSLPGACCLRPTGCALMSDLACVAALGFFRGPETICGSEPCPVMGVCCTPTGACVLAVPPANCQSPDIWYGAWSDCAVASCPMPMTPGACCDFPTGQCTATLETECVPPYTWLANSTCTVVTCPPPGPPIAACCRYYGDYVECRMTTEAGCTPPGVWHLVLPTCDPNICPMPIPVRHTSWGSIKASYR